MLAAARALGYHPYRKVPNYCNRSAAEHDARTFFDHCMNMYETIAGKPNGTVEQKNRRATIVSYFSQFPMTVIASANKSSRPLSRKANPDPLEGRAISLDQLSKHDGAYLTSTLGVAKALHYMNGLLRNGGPEPQQAAAAIAVPMSPVRHTFLANKTFRDFVRMQAVVLWQKDFPAAWALRGGEPSQSERLRLVEEYLQLQQKKGGGVATPRQFLARIELNDHVEAALLVEALTGVPAPKDVQLRDPLEIGWKSIAATMHFRRQQSALAQVVETDSCLMIQQLTRQLAQQKEDISLKQALAVQERLAYYGYVGANYKFSTPSLSLSATDPQKEGNLLLGEEATQKRIQRPLWLLNTRQHQAKL